MTTLRELGEFGFIGRIAELAGAAPSEVVQGIDDDCAVLDLASGDNLLVTVDAAVEGRHFNTDWLTPFEVGQRTMAGALSDIAAMGGRPLASLCTVALSATVPSDDALALMAGVADTARRYSAPLIGGDTVSTPGPILLDVVVLGFAREPWLRSGARPGDKLFLTGALGEAGAALEILQRRPELMDDARFADLRRRFADPVPRLGEAAVLADTGAVHAAIDISDGLYQDAGHIARASGVRLEIHAGRIPATDACRLAGTCVPGEAGWWAATSGEEYELLLAVDKRRAAELASLLNAQGLAPLTEIGDVRSGEGVILIRDDGSEIQMERGGWDHFRTDAA